MLMYTVAFLVPKVEAVVGGIEEKKKKWDDAVIIKIEKATYALKVKEMRKVVWWTLWRKL